MYSCRSNLNSEKPEKKADTPVHNMRGSHISHIMQLGLIVGAFLPLVAGQASYRQLNPGEIVPMVVETAVDGVAGHTTYELLVAIGGDVENVYTQASTRAHMSYFPGAHQVRRQLPRHA
jgi:hypothetical protein